MFSAFRRPSHPPSSSSHTASSSSASGSVISADNTFSRLRSPDNASSSAYDSDAPASQRARSNSIGGWESDSRTKSVRWNPASRAGHLKNISSASGYSTDAAPSSAPRQRTYSSSRSKTSNGSGAPPAPSSNYSAGSSDDFQMAVDRLLRISTKAFAITGTVPLFAPISLFFQTSTGSCHLLRFPSESSIPSRTFDAFMAACEPVSSPTGIARGTYHTFRANPARPITPSFDIASHPILNTIKATLFPAASESQHLTATLSRVDVYCPGASSSQGRFVPAEDDDVVAHVVVTLPVRFRGGMMSVAKDGNEERFWGRGTLSAGSASTQSTAFNQLDSKKVAGSLGSIEWIAYLARGECDQRIEKVEKGVRINLVYDLTMRNYAPVLVNGVPFVQRPLITPNDNLLAAVSSVLKRSRGMKLAFYLTNDYGVAPSHIKPDALIPQLKGTDLALYHSLKFYNLQPVLRYTAGGFIWPPNACATISPQSQYLETMKRLALKSAGDDEDLTIQIEDGGGVRLEREGIQLVTGKEQGKIGSERLAFVSERESKLEYLHVNVCLVVYVH